jgi:hypothetical protein
MEDYRYSFTNCIDKSRTKQHYWNEPKICTENGGTPLPPDESGLPCAKCNPGYYHKIIDQSDNESVCMACEDGTYITEEHDI